MVGMIQQDAQMRSFLVAETLGIYVFRVIVRSVTIAMARMEKSAA
jgi:hypothetical protein